MTGGVEDVDLKSPTFYWNTACEMARWLRKEGNVPPPMNLEGPIMQQGEQGRIAVPHVRYDRLYGGSGRYRTINPFVAGSTGFVVGAWGAALLANQYAKEKAQQNAQVRWRDEATAVVYITSQRVITALPERTLDFALSRVSAFHVDFDNWNTMLEFTGDVAPLRLTGPPAPVLALWIAYGLFGSGWQKDSRFDRLGPLEDQR